MSLKEQTHASHQLAEQHRFTKLLVSGNMAKSIYYDYLFNQLAAYKKLEHLCKSRGLLNNLPGIYRTPAIYEDLQELIRSMVFPPLAATYPATTAYENHLDTLNDAGLLAHVYVRHMGDMYGGQMIKRVIPGSGLMYEFENRNDTIKALREKLSDNMAAEANKCFELIFDLFDELADEHNI
jgi:heme oxygenase